MPIDLRHTLSEHDAHTAEWAGFKGKKNGDLLKAAEAADYDVLLTVDKGILHQQPSSARSLSIIVLRSRTSQLEDLLPLMVLVTQALTSIRPGQVVSIPPH